MRKKPNFVLFITDQQRADWLGCYGHPVEVRGTLGFTAWGELYDLAADQQETTNLWNDPDHDVTRAMLTDLLARALIGQMDESPSATRLA